MSTKVYKDSSSILSITRFYGGDNRGTCAQINIAQSYVQLTREKILLVVECLNKIVKYEDERRERSLKTTTKTVDN